MNDTVIGPDARPFEGIKATDLTHVLAGPFCAYQLAVLGAAVIKVEPPGEPDQVRARRPPVGRRPGGRGRGPAPPCPQVQGTAGGPVPRRSVPMTG